MPSPDWKAVADRAALFIREQVSGAGASGVVFGLSGGIDSSVTAYLCKRAMADRCLAVLMPNSAFTPDSETADGLAVADELSMKREIIPIRKISDLISSGDAADRFLGGGPQMRRAVGNLNARIRAILLYYEAQKRDYLVVGTDDRSEYLIGYFTKYGDGASDMLPIAGLYKTQVQELGRFLGVPLRIVEKPPSPHLWKNHDAVREIGMEYSVIDRILESMEPGSDADEIAEELGVGADMVRRIDSLQRGSEHKRHMPPIAQLL